jgi:hypothetical protein
VGNEALSESTSFSELLGTASPPPPALSEASQAPALTIERIAPDHDSPLPKETTATAPARTYDTPNHGQKWRWCVPFIKFFIYHFWF